MLSGRQRILRQLPQRESLGGTARIPSARAVTAGGELHVCERSVALPLLDGVVPGRFSFFLWSSMPGQGARPGKKADGASHEPRVRELPLHDESAEFRRQIFPLDGEYITEHEKAPM